MLQTDKTGVLLYSTGCMTVKKTLWHIRKTSVAAELFFGDFSKGLYIDKKF